MSNNTDVFYEDELLLSLATSNMAVVLGLLAVDRDVCAPKQKRVRERQPRPDFENTVWAEALRDPRVKDPLSHQGKKFRRRFRVPYPMFEYLNDFAERRFPSRQDAAGQPPVPMALKVLGVLRILGRAFYFDDVAEVTRMGERTIGAFFHAFIPAFVAAHKTQWIAPPRSKAEMDALSEQYAEVGLPGCKGSTDVVHLKCIRLPYSDTHLNTGKEGYPTVAFQVTSDHKRNAMQVNQIAHGAHNDRGIVKTDEFIVKANDGDLFQQDEFAVLTALADETEEKDQDTFETIKGGYFIVDGGYPKWTVLQDTTILSATVDALLYAKHLESVRKDVECFFGTVVVPLSAVFILSRCSFSPRYAQGPLQDFTEPYLSAILRHH